MGSHHARQLLARGDVDLVVVDPALGLPAPARLDADFAVVATPTVTHLDVARPLLEAGLPCLVEKPLAHNADAAFILAQYGRLTVGHVERYNPALDALWALQPRWVEAERLAPAGPRGLDVDVIDDLMVHDLDLARALLGGRLHEARAVGVGVHGLGLDIVKARLELGIGVADLTASRVSRAAHRRIRVVSEGVYWSADLAGRTLTRVRWGEGELEGERIAVAPEDPLQREHAAFLAAVRGEAPFPVPGAEGLAALQLAAAVRAALDRGPMADQRGPDRL